MLSLRQHFQRIKEIVDWSWTLAILCMVGYITLGQLAQLYWAMVVFGGLAGSFGLFYEFSCEKLADLNAIEDTYKLQKIIATSALAQDLLGKFAHRNPEIKNQFPAFDQLRYQVSNIRATSAAKFKQRVHQQTKTSSQSSTQPPYQKPVQPTPPYAPPIREAQPPLKKATQPQPQKPAESTPPYTPPKREAQPPLKKTTQPQSQKPAESTPPYAPPKREAQPPLKKATQPKISLEEYKRILNKSDYVPVKPHLRNGHWVRGHYRRKPKR